MITKKIIFLLGFSFIYNALIAQATGVVYNRGIIYSPGQYTDIQGSPYLEEKWQSGWLIVDDGKQYKLSQLKFDIVKNKFVFNQNDTSFELQPIVKEVVLKNQGNDSLIFKNGFQNIPNIDRNYFLQVLVEGKITFLKNIQKKIEDEYQYGNADKTKTFKLIHHYYILTPETVKEINLSEKDLHETLKDKWDKIQEFIKQNKYSFKKEENCMEIIRYYNSL